ncbi:FAD-dependent oxidoreductase [uncultured Paraglaciecola sp.]|uniref:FAD-dependent oxidoreductase n=1 Tax=uncultured Paraglaciecola sp. TaxID=1765024 RepID=UPI0030DA60B3|tara:strand:+ start:2181 stop:3392 length:1212 start_codon:yes stop_codon:yes gene_type:complete
MQSYDVVVIGGGVVGLTVALTLATSELNVAVIDAQVGDTALGVTPQLRVSTFTLATQTVMQKLGAWQLLDQARLCAYQHMSVWDQDSFANIGFSHDDVQQSYLGHVVENQNLRRALWLCAQQSAKITLIAPNKVNKMVFGQQESFLTLDDDTMLSARLVVGADGANSMVRQNANLPLTFWDYEHHSIVATIKTQFPHENTARQVFTPHGPLAFLPLWDEHHCSIVWSQQEPIAKALLSLDNDAFAKALMATFDMRLGICEVVSERQSFPLKMRYARQWVTDRVALVGDAAHTIHPLAGQGANLGIMDAVALAEQVIKISEQGKDIGLGKNLRPYERWRKTEAVKMIATMESFKRLFDGANPVQKLVRDIGLSAMNHLPKAKQNIVRHAIGLSGELPALAMDKK